jgi:hypothetical protein
MPFDMKPVMRFYIAWAIRIGGSGNMIRNKITQALTFVLFSLMCTLIGVLLGIHITLVKTTDDLRASVNQVDDRLEDMQDVVKDYVSDRAIILESFQEIEARLLRHEHLMRVPRSERRETWRQLEEEAAQ